MLPDTGCSSDPVAFLGFDFGTIRARNDARWEKSSCVSYEDNPSTRQSFEPYCSGTIGTNPRYEFHSFDGSCGYSNPDDVPIANYHEECDNFATHSEFFRCERDIPSDFARILFFPSSSDGCPRKQLSEYQLDAYFKLDTCVPANVFRMTFPVSVGSFIVGGKPLTLDVFAGLECDGGLTTSYVFSDGKMSCPAASNPVAKRRWDSPQLDKALYVGMGDASVFAISDEVIVVAVAVPTTLVLLCVLVVIAVTVAVVCTKRAKERKKKNERLGEALKMSSNTTPVVVVHPPPGPAQCVSPPVATSVGAPESYGGDVAAPAASVMMQQQRQQPSQKIGAGKEASAPEPPDYY